MGLRYGLATAVVFTAVAAAIAAVYGDNVMQREFGLTLWGLAGVYFGLGLMLGGGVGAVLPLIKTELAARWVGFVAALILHAAVVVTMFGPGRWFPLGVVTTVLGSSVLGPYMGAWYWRRCRGEDG